MKCVAPLAVSHLGGGSGSDPDPAIVIGKTGTGKAGMWIFAADKKFEAPYDETTGKASPELPESDDHDGNLHARFGWTYHVMGVSNGIAAGYIENKNGLSFGKYTVDPGTTVGVYWRIWTVGHNSHARVIVSHAHVIGTYAASTSTGGGSGKHSILSYFFRHWLDSLKLFFLDRLSSYLTMVDQDGVSFDSSTGLYSITGTDQDGDPATATLDAEGNITITPNAPPPPPPPPPNAIDLVPTSVSVNSTSGVVGTNVPVTVKVANNSSNNSVASFQTDFYLALGATFSPSTDPKIGSVTATSGIGAKATITLSTMLTIPSMATVGASVDKDLYIYAYVDAANDPVDSNTSNNVSTTDTSAILLIAGSPPPQTYYLKIETYATTTSSATNTGIALFKENGGGSMTYEGSDITSVPSYYGSLDYTAAGNGLTSGRYYIAVIPLQQDGSFVLDVRTLSVPGQALADPASDPSTTNDNRPSLVPAMLTNPPVPNVSPAAPYELAPGNAVSWVSQSGVTDWFSFTLP